MYRWYIFILCIDKVIHRNRIFFQRYVDVYSKTHWLFFSYSCNDNHPFMSLCFKLCWLVFKMPSYCLNFHFVYVIDIRYCRCVVIEIQNVFLQYLLLWLFVYNAIYQLNIRFFCCCIWEESVLVIENS